MKPPTMPVMMPTAAPRNSRQRLASMCLPSSPSTARVHTTSTTSVTGGSVALLGWKIAQPAIHTSRTRTNGSRRQQPPRHRAEPCAGLVADECRLHAHLRSIPQRATVMFSIGCTIRRSTTM